jgi:hypothetical protein
MKKILCFPILTAGIALSLAASANAATIAYKIEVPFTNTSWEFPDTSPVLPPLQFPKYNPANFQNRPLLGVRVQAIGRTQGSYFLRNDNPPPPPNRIITYGTFSNQVGAGITIEAPTFSIALNPVPFNAVTPGVLTPQQSLSLSLDGQATQNFNVASTDPNFTNYIFTGIGPNAVVLDRVAADSLINVSKLGTPFTETAIIRASLELNVSYDIPDLPLEIPDRSFGIGGLIFCGLAGLALKGIRKSNRSD